MSQPRFQTNEIVYLRETAVATGSLESYLISEVKQASDGNWSYMIAFNGGATGPLFGDRITHHQPISIVLTEPELVTLCEAVDLAEETLNQRLTALEALRAAHCQ